MPPKTSLRLYLSAFFLVKFPSVREDARQHNLLLQDALTKLMLILIAPPPSRFFLSSLGHPDLFCLLWFTFVLNVGLKAIVKNMRAVSLSMVLSPTPARQSVWKRFQAPSSRLDCL